MRGADNLIMPELPEVEVTRQSFADRIEGARVESVRVGKPLRWPLGVSPEVLVGSTVGAAMRRGKYIWLPLTRPAEGAASAVSAGGLLLHLGMSGALSFSTVAAAAGPHDHFDLITSCGVLRLTDPRRFGAVVWSPSLTHDPAARLLRGLGREPFDAALSGADLQAAWRGRRVSIKQALLAGDVVVGAGNIYACEALFMAGINPRLPAGRLSRVRCDRLLQAIRTVLQRALDVGGTSLRNFTDAHGDPGAFQFETKVYGREGQWCLVCGATAGQRIRRIVQGQRSTFFCPGCQRR